MAAACKETAISEQSDYRWKKEYSGLKPGLAKKRRNLERENAPLKKIVADLSLSQRIKQMPQSVVVQLVHERYQTTEFT